MMQAFQPKNQEVEEEEILDTEEEDQQGSLFKRETDPSKLGKALSDRNTREVIIGVLLMLMVLPLLSPTEIDYSQEYGLREIFWMGRSSCIKSPEMIALEEAQFKPNVPADQEYSVVQAKTYNSFYCKDPLPAYCAEKENFEMTELEMSECLPWVTPLGWAELLRMYTTASAVPESGEKNWNLLWLYVPDYLNNG